MTQDEIIAMAREAGLLPDNAHPAPETRAMRQRSEAVQIFATLIAEKAAANEREACAQVCEGFKQGNSATYIDDDWADMCAEAIRARGTKEGA